MSLYTYIHRANDGSKFHKHVSTHIVRMVIVIDAVLHEGTSPECRTGLSHDLYRGSLRSLQLISMRMMIMEVSFSRRA